MASGNSYGMHHSRENPSRQKHFLVTDEERETKSFSPAQWTSTTRTELSSLVSLELYWLEVIIIQRTSETGGKGVKLSCHQVTNMTYASDCNTQRIKYKLLILKLAEISDNDHRRCN